MYVSYSTEGPMTLLDQAKLSLFGLGITFCSVLFCPSLSWPVFESSSASPIALCYGIVFLLHQRSS